MTIKKLIIKYEEEVKESHLILKRINTDDVKGERIFKAIYKTIIIKDTFIKELKEIK